MINVLDQIKAEEGCVLHCYVDSLGWQTIGYGRLIDVRKGGGISQAEADLLLANDVKSAETNVLARLPWAVHLTEPRRAVLTSMAFQMGIAGLLGFEKTLAAVRDAHYDHAAELMLQSKWGEHDSPARARRLSRQMATGEWN